MMTIIRIVAELLIVGYLIYLAIYDIRHHKVTNNSVLLFLPIVWLKCTVTLGFGTLGDLIPMLLGSAAGFVILLLSAMLTHGGIGGGDIKLAAVLGLATGLRGMLLLLCVASVGAVLFGAVYRLIKKEKLAKLPFVPFMTVGYLISLL